MSQANPLSPSPRARAWSSWPIIALLAIAVLGACPSSVRGGSADKLRILSTSLSPQPYDPTTQATVSLTAGLAVRATDGLGSQGASQNNTTFTVHSTLTISSTGAGAATIATIIQDTVIAPPLTYITLPAPGGSGAVPWVQVPATILNWDGKNASDHSCVADGTYGWTLIVDYTRTKDVGNGTKTKDILDSAATVAGTLTVQGSLPVITLTSPADGAMTRNLSIPVTFKVATLLPVNADVSGTTAVSTGPGTFAATATLPVECRNVLTIHASDCSGRQAVPLSFGVLRDTQPPLVALSGVSVAWINSKSPPIRADYRDACTGVDLATVKLLSSGADISSFFEIGPTAATVKTSANLNLPEGPARIDAVAADLVGNVGAAPTLSFGVDTIPPVATLQVPAITNRKTPPISLSYFDPGAPLTGSGIDPSSVHLGIDGNDVTTSFQITASSATLRADANFGLSDGVYRVNSVVSDVATNTTTASASVLVDTIPPRISISAPSVTNSRTPPISLLYSDAGSSVATSTLHVFADNAEITNLFDISQNIATLRSDAVLGWADTVHRLSATLRDRATNSSTATASVLVDTVAPNLKIVSPAAGTTVTTATPVFSVAFDDGTGSGVATASFQASVDGQSRTAKFQITGTGATWRPTAGDSLPGGQHVFSVTVADLAGNTAQASSSFQITLGPPPPQRVPTSGFICGTALDGAGQPLAGVSVTVKGVPGTIVSDARGRYTFPTLDSGDYLVTFKKDGYSTVQRQVTIVRGRDTAVPPPQLIPLDPNVNTITTASGGTATDSTGRITLSFPPGSLPVDVALRVTDLPNSRVVPNYLPTESQYLACFRVDPPVECLAPVHVKYRLATSSHFPVGTKIPAGHYSEDTGLWSHGTFATVAADGITAECDVSRFSAWDINMAAFRGDEGSIPHAGEIQTPCADGSCKARQNVHASSVDLTKGAFLEDHVLPSWTGERRPTRLVYSSSTADPHPILNFTTAGERVNWTSPNGIRFDYSIGSVYNEHFYQPIQQDNTFRYQWDARDRDGQKVPTGSYAYKARISYDFNNVSYGLSNLFGDPALLNGPGLPRTKEPVPVREVVQDKIPVLNRRSSPFGAGWGLDGLSQLHFDPDGSILAEDGNGRATAFKPAEIIYGIQQEFNGAPYATTRYVAYDAASHTVINTALLPVANFRRSFGRPTDPVFFPDGNGDAVYFFGTDHGVYRLTPSATQPELKATVSIPASTVKLAVNRDGSKVLVAGADNLVFGSVGRPRLFAVNTSDGTNTEIQLQSLLSGLYSVNGAVMSASGNRAYVTLTRYVGSGFSFTFSGVLLTADLQALTATVQPLPAPEGSLALSRDEMQLTMLGSPVLLYDTGSATITAQVSPLPGTRVAQRATYSGDDSTVLIGYPADLSLTATIRFIDRAGNYLGSMKSICMDYAFTPDGRGAYGQADFGMFWSSAPDQPALGDHAGTPLYFADFKLRDNYPVIPSFAGYQDLSNSAYSNTNFIPYAVVQPGGLYYGPQGESSRLVKNPDGTLVRTLTGGHSGGCSICDPHIEYDAQGLQRAVQDDAARRWLYDYDPQGRLVAITHPAGEGTTTLAYGTTGIQSITDPAGRVTQFVVDRSGNLVSITHPPGGGTRSFEYDSEHRMTAGVDRLGARSTIAYDTTGHVTDVFAAGTRHTTLIAQDTQGLANSLTGTLGSASQPAAAPMPTSVASTVTDPDGITHSVRTNPLGQEVQRTDPAGGVSSQYPDTNNLVSLSKDELGRRTNYAYAVDHAVQRVVYPDLTQLNITNVQVGTRSLPSVLKYPSGATTSLAYNGGGQVTQVTDPVGKSVGVGYDGKNDPKSVQMPTNRSLTISRTDFSAPSAVSFNPPLATDASATTHLAYDTARNVVTATDPLGASTHYTPDGMGRVTGITDPLGNSTALAYDPDGNLTRFTDARSNSTQMTWVSGHRLTRMINALQQATDFTYTDAGRLSGTKNFRGETTANGYDNLGRLSTATDAGGGTRKYQWDPASQLVGVVDPLGHATAISYDTQGRVSAVTNADTTSTTRTYYPDGELKTLTDEVGRKTTFGVDPAGHVTSIADPTGAAVVLGYDDDGRVISRKDRLGQETKYGFDGLGRLATVTLPDGTPYATTYDLAGNLVALKSGKGGTWTYSWDAKWRLKSKKDPLGNECRYDYHPNGTLRTVDEPGENGTRLVTTMDYDALNRPTSIVAPDRTLTISYADATHAVHIAISPDSITIDRALDALNRIVRETTTSSITTTLEYGWDAASNMRTVTQNGALVLSLDYDARNRVTRIRDERRGRSFTFAYTKAGELQTVTYPSGVTKKQVWGSRGELQSIEFRTAVGALLLRRAYNYDASLQITQIASEAGVLVSYGYSAVGQIKSANYADGDFEAWDYDANGNIASYRHGASSETRVHDDADQLTRIDAAGGGAISALYVHDPRGNIRHRITSTEDREYVWDAQGHLRVVQVNGQPQLKARYLDGAQLESLETPADGATVFSVAFGAILSEFQGGVEAMFSIGQSGLDQPLDRGPPAGPSQTLATDHIESVIAALDEGGNLLSGTGYSAYGMTRLGPDPGKVGYAGARRDPGTGLAYLRARWMDPQIGRFLSRDPIGFAGGLNLYAYSGNDPISRRDPMGLDALFVDPSRPDRLVNTGPAAGGLPGPTGNVISDRTEHVYQGAPAPKPYDPIRAMYDPSLSQRERDLARNDYESGDPSWKYPNNSINLVDEGIGVATGLAAERAMRFMAPDLGGGGGGGGGGGRSGGGSRGCSARPDKLYRIITDKDPVANFASNYEKGLPPRGAELKFPETHRGISMFDSVEAAQKRVPIIERNNTVYGIAEVTPGADWNVSKTFGPGHYTVYGPPADLAAGWQTRSILVGH